MKLSTSLVAVKKIQSSVDSAKFNQGELERLAHAILGTEGLLNPIVLQRKTLDSYDVISGYFEYHAAVLAREIDPRKGEMVSAFIIGDDKEEYIYEQIKLLRQKSSDDNQENISVTQPSLVNTTELETIIKNSNNFLKKQIEDLKQQIDNLIQSNQPQKTRNILRKHLENVLSESENKSQKEFLKSLVQDQQELQKYQDEITNRIQELSKIDLRTASKDEIEKKIREVGGNKKAVDAIWKAFEYWNKPDKQLTWDNLKKSTNPKDKENKITDFGKVTLGKLQKIGYLED